MTEYEPQTKTAELIALSRQLTKKESIAQQGIHNLQHEIETAQNGKRAVFSQARELGIFHQDLCQHLVIKATEGKPVCVRCGKPTSIFDPVFI